MSLGLSFKNLRAAVDVEPSVSVRMDQYRICIVLLQACPIFHASVCVDSNTWKWKSGEKQEGLGVFIM